MVINADLHQAALGGQDDETVKYVQSISSLCRVPIFQITAVLISNSAEKSNPISLLWSGFRHLRWHVGMGSLLKGLGPWCCKVLQAALGRALLCLPDMWSRSSTVLPLLCACFGNRRGKDPRLARQIPMFKSLLWLSWAWFPTFWLPIKLSSFCLLWLELNSLLVKVQLVKVHKNYIFFNITVLFLLNLIKWVHIETFQYHRDYY